MKLLFILIAVLFGCVKGNEEHFRKMDSIRPEEPCSAAGGICTIAKDCPAGQLSEKRGLCPEQRSQGIECCHGISVRETRCQPNGGHCISADTFCNPSLIFSRASDCPEHHKCCILVV